MYKMSTMIVSVCLIIVVIHYLATSTTARVSSNYGREPSELARTAQRRHGVFSCEVSRSIRSMILRAVALYNYCIVMVT